MRNIAGIFSMLMPGVRQMYNKEFTKSIIFLVIEHFDGIGANLNKAIQLDVNGFHQQALIVVNYQYLLFCPGFYVYTIWDAWYHAKTGANKTTTAIPFIIAGFLGEFATIFAVKIPFPRLTIALSIIVSMIIGMVIFRRQ